MYKNLSLNPKIYNEGYDNLRLILSTKSIN